MADPPALDPVLAHNLGVVTPPRSIVRLSPSVMRSPPPRSALKASATARPRRNSSENVYAHIAEAEKRSQAAQDVAELALRSSTATLARTEPARGDGFDWAALASRHSASLAAAVVALLAVLVLVSFRAPWIAPDSRKGVNWVGAVGTGVGVFLVARVLGDGLVPPP